MIDLGALLSQLVSTYWWGPLLYVLAELFKSAWFKQTVKPGTGTWQGNRIKTVTFPLAVFPNNHYPIQL